MKNAKKILVEKPEERANSGDLGISGRTILKWALGR
jgi:hypothetical protein